MSSFEDDLTTGLTPPHNTTSFLGFIGHFSVVVVLYFNKTHLLLYYKTCLLSSFVYLLFHRRAMNIAVMAADLWVCRCIVGIRGRNCTTVVHATFENSRCLKDLH